MNEPGWLLPSDVACAARCHWDTADGWMAAAECEVHRYPVFAGWRPRYAAWASFPFPEPGLLRRGVMLVMN